MLVLSIFTAPLAGADTPISVEVERAAHNAYVVDAAFEEVRIEILARAAR